MNRRALAALVLPATVLTACSGGPSADASRGSSTSTAGAASGPTTVRVTSKADSCTLSATSVPAGKVVFDITNDDTRLAEFYLYRQDGIAIVGEMENIGPSLSRELVLDVPAGTYQTACKPGMEEKGIRAAFTVTGAAAPAATGDEKAQIDAATSAYAAYVREQSADLLEKTKQFAALYTAGKHEEARTLYPIARSHWERIEPVAESFGDLDPRMDAREADVPAGQAWTGWHVMEKDLWPPKSGYRALTPAQRATTAKQLVADTEELVRRTSGMTFTVNQIANGTKSLLDEIATGKVTGEEEIWSHTDLYDVRANLDGARLGWQVVRPILTAKDPALDARIAQRFVAMDDALHDGEAGEGYKSYTDLTKEEVRRLADAVNALSEPISKVPAAVTR